MTSVLQCLAICRIYLDIGECACKKCFTSLYVQKKINRIDNFKRHVAICDGEKKDLECHNCGAVFKRKFNLDRHKETCKNELWYFL